jgi:alanine-glyoxylate transaminase/(R)-3-amino-2-methylpropionate-pyruvate transaminase
MWGFESHRVVPDIVVMATGIGNGIPLSAVVARREVAEHMAAKFIFHTYGSNPMACAAGRAVLQVIREDDMIANAAHVGAVLKAHMEDTMQNHHTIGNVCGKGFIIAMEMF